jgi:hypothetical protein
VVVVVVAVMAFTFLHHLLLQRTDQAVVGAPRRFAGTLLLQVHHQHCNVILAASGSSALGHGLGCYVGCFTGATGHAAGMAGGTCTLGIRLRSVTHSVLWQQQEQQTPQRLYIMVNSLANTNVCLYDEYMTALHH